MPAIKHFFVLNSRGSPILIRSFLTEPSQEAVEYFYQKVISTSCPPPIFHFENHHFAYIMYANLYFVLSTSESMSPTLLLELLTKVTILFTDYIGTCSEIKMQKNLAICYEILDEAVSFGCPQATESGHLLHLVHNTVYRESGLINDYIEKELDPSKGFVRPLAIPIEVRNKAANDCFMVFTETLNLELSAQNRVLNSSVSGTARIKSFLLGSPSVMVQLDPQVTVKTRPIPKDLMIKLDDIVFAPSIQAKSFDSDRSINFAPPDGLSDIFYYRTSEVKHFLYQINYDFENKQNKVAVCRVTVRSTYPAENYTNYFSLKFQCPVEISSASCEVHSSVQETQSSEFDRKNRQIIWKIKKFQGLSEFTARFRFIFDDGILIAPELILGPIALDFSIWNILPSGLGVKEYLVSTTGTQMTPNKWMKRECLAGSYTYNLA